MKFYYFILINFIFYSLSFQTRFFGHKLDLNKASILEILRYYDDINLSNDNFINFEVFKLISMLRRDEFLLSNNSYNLIKDLVYCLDEDGTEGKVVKNLVLQFSVNNDYKDLIKFEIDVLVKVKNFFEYFKDRLSPVEKSFLLIETDYKKLLFLINNNLKKLYSAIPYSFFNPIFSLKKFFI
jgi:hypothetical protein